MDRKYEKYQGKAMEKIDDMCERRPEDVVPSMGVRNWKKSAGNRENNWGGQNRYKNAEPEEEEEYILHSGWRSLPWL